MRSTIITKNIEIFMSDLSKKIDMLYENKTLREQLVSNASEYAYKRYDYDKHFDRLEEILKNL